MSLSVCGSEFGGRCGSAFKVFAGRADWPMESLLLPTVTCHLCLPKVWSTRANYAKRDCKATPLQEAIKSFSAHREF